MVEVQVSGVRSQVSEKHLFREPLTVALEPVAP